MLRLDRLQYGSKEGEPTLGVLVFEHPDHEARVLFTVEDAWLGNAANRSCIPDGYYTCRPRRFEKKGYDAIEISGVPGRSTILIHKGNRDEDVTGCVVVGARIGILAGEVAVLDSAAAFAWLMENVLHRYREFPLSIGPIARGMAGAVLGPGMNGWRPEMADRE